MKLIGLLGGMSWESSALYYRLMNEEVRTRIGGLHSARILMHSVDFHEIEIRQHKGNWEGTAQILGRAAEGLRAGGAEFLVLATNTMHKVAYQITALSGLELLHIADPTGAALIGQGIKRVGLLGTRFTMEQDFYRSRLIEKFELDVLVPEAKEREIIHRVIYDELCLGVSNPQSIQAFIDIIDMLKSRGAEAIVLGCTEITMIIDSANSPLPVYDTTHLHALAAVDYALS